jgi:wyosine [tRNA(Phe)-imidazoG37] synthetase (radical SAM superfamily)
MDNNKKLIAFGPVPSRRLGRSLGINNIPPKICSYSCIYCQLGRTKNMQIDRSQFYKPEEIVQEVRTKIEKADDKGEKIDYLTFVPHGEPTLDINLGAEIELLKDLDYKIAVITNASLIHREDVRNELSLADWVSLKVDTVTQSIWKKVNRPYKILIIDKILKGMFDFANQYKGELVTETMLVHNINDDFSKLENVANFITSLQPDKSYISIPIRPSAERWVKPANESAINLGFQLFRDRGINVEFLIGYEGNTFAFTGNIEMDLLSITSVHPMREDSVNELLTKAGKDWQVIEKLINENKMVEVLYNNEKFFLRKFPNA